MHQNKTIYNVGSPYQLAERVLEFFTSLNFKGGFFLEAGASNGVWQSNSYYLENILNWNGILVEPNTSMFTSCMQNRKNSKNHFFNCALVSEEYSLDSIKGYFNERDYENILMAQIEGVEQSEERSKRWIGKQAIPVPARTLNSIMEEVGNKVDFLSLDVEGYEVEALNGSKIEKHRPKYVCVEVWSDGGQQEKIKDYFFQRGYKINQYLSERDILFEDNKEENNGLLR